MIDMNQICIDELLPKQQRKRPIETLKLFELFAGYGSQSLALKRFNVPFENVGYCEIDKYAIQAYKALHGEHIKNYGDITKVNVDELQNMNLLTYSFPCQDISVAGKQKGLSKDSGTRSSLLWECHRIIEAKRPEYLMMENVKNLVGKQNMPDFQAWLDTLTLLGYNNYWKVVNAKHCGVPQNRERVFCVSIRQDVDDGLFRFEEPFDNGLRLKDLLESKVDEKYYISEEKTKNLIKQLHETGKANTNPSGNGMNGNVYNGEYSPTLTTNKGEGLKVVIPCITPDRLEKRQNGRRFKDDGDPMFTLTSQDRHGVLIDDTQGFDGVRIYKNESPCLRSQRSGLKVFEATKQGYAIANEGDSINLEHPNSKTRRGRVGVGVAQTLTTSCNQAVVEPKYRIRKLTPKECFRLMGLSDYEIEKIQSTDISNSQQYKMAGNSIVVDAMEFLKNINGGDRNED